MPAPFLHGGSGSDRVGGRRDSSGDDTATVATSDTPGSSSSLNGQKKNYKNMTRVRRVEANARERTRVHTIGSAFDELRHAVPSYSFNQKLSKLAILRIASTYIQTLGKMLDRDYSADGKDPSLAECVELVGKTIQTEGREGRVGRRLEEKAKEEGKRTEEEKVLL